MTTLNETKPTVPCSVLLLQSYSAAELHDCLGRLSLMKTVRKRGWRDRAVRPREAQQLLVDDAAVVQQCRRLRGQAQLDQMFLTTPLRPSGTIQAQVRARVADEVGPHDHDRRSCAALVRLSSGRRWDTRTRKRQPLPHPELQRLAQHDEVGRTVPMRQVNDNPGIPNESRSSPPVGR